MYLTLKVSVLILTKCQEDVCVLKLTAILCHQASNKTSRRFNN